MFVCKECGHSMDDDYADLNDLTICVGCADTNREIEKNGGEIMKRNKNLQDFIDDFAKKSFGYTQTDALFSDALSEKEYSISGMCQKCQDEIFK